MLQRLESLAELSIGRACGFAAIGIGTFMIGFYGDMPRATQIGGIASLLAALILLARGLAAPRHPYKRTELWIMLKPGERPQPEVAQKLIGNVLRETYLRFALRAGQMAVGFLTLSLALSFWGR